MTTSDTPSLQLGDIAPDFNAETTAGDISFHKWVGNSWFFIGERDHLFDSESNIIQFKDLQRPDTLEKP